VTTTRRGWRAALDSSLLLAVVVCASASALAAAAPAAAVVAGRAPAAVAPAGPAAALVAAGPHRAVVDKGSPWISIIALAALAVAPAPSTGWSSRTFENAPRDSAENDDDDDDDEALEHALTPVAARGVETRRLTHIEPDPSLSLESDGHSLRAPPR
jgi:hypothetical protein